MAERSFADLALVVSYEVDRALIIASPDESLCAFSGLLHGIYLVEVLRHLGLHLSDILSHSVLLGLLEIQIALAHLYGFEIDPALGIAWSLLERGLDLQGRLEPRSLQLLAKDV